MASNLIAIPDLHRMSAEEIDQTIKERLANAERLPQGPEKARVTAEAAQLRTYVDMKLLLRPHGPRISG
jgi:hypothetical protein